MTISAVHASRLRAVFRAVAFAEALSWAGLLVGMLFKYGISGTELGVKLFGPLHGAIFVAYVVLCIAAARAFRWSTLTTLLALASSIPPFFTYLFEVVVDRQGLLRPPEGRVGSDRWAQ